MRQKLSDYQQSMYNFLSPTAAFIAVCAIVYALFMTKVLPVPKLGLIDLCIIALASFRLIRFFCFDSMFNYVRDRISYHTRVVEEGGEVFVERKPVGIGFRRMLTNLLDCVWCVGIWTSLLSFMFYIISAETKLIVYVLAIAGVATFFQLLASLVATHYEACDLKNEEVRKSLTK